MDIDDWELLPATNGSSHCTTMFEFGLESEEDLLFSKQTNFFGPVAIVDNHYFILPSPRPSDIPKDESSTSAEEDAQEEESVVEFKDIGVVPTPLPPQVIVASQAIFNKLKDDELDDMSVWYPNFSPRGKIVPLIGQESVEKEEEYVNHDKRKKPCWEGFGLKIGALCSVGAAAAAATICVFVLGAHHQPSHEKYSQRLQFHIYTDDKRINQVVQRASRPSCSLAAARGAQMTRAHISFGGHYTGF